MRRMIDTPKKKQRRWLLAGVLLIGLIAGVVLTSGSAVMIHHTNQTQFCVSCHVYDDFYAELQQSSHWNNASGVRVGCDDCHIPKDSLSAMVWTKAKSGAAAFNAYFLAGVDTPEEFAEQRYALQQQAHDWFKANDSRTCRNCHVADAMLTDKQSSAAKASHAMLGADGPTCVDCHSGVPHGQVQPPKDKDDADQS
jgi:cytochrome c-type protein NapC